MLISRVGFGAWALGGGGWSFGWGPQDDKASIAAIRHAVEHGVNWIDTAPMYGLGHSEAVVAEALAPFAEVDRPYVFTKCGFVADPADPSLPPTRTASAAGIRAEVEASLRRLRVDRLDLLQVHWPPDDGTRLDEYWGCLLELKAEGTVAAVGLSNHRLAHLKAAERLGHVDSLQPPFSAVHRLSAERLIPWCAEAETGVVVYSPMQSGLLTGAFDAARVAALPDDDFRRRDPDFTDHLAANLTVSDALAEVGARHGVSTAAAAIAWVLAWPGVTGAIVGARSVEQVQGWLPAASLALDAADMEVVAAAIEARGVGEGPLRP